jgi:hypothetical protein
MLERMDSGEDKAGGSWGVREEMPKQQSREVWRMRLRRLEVVVLLLLRLLQMMGTFEMMKDLVLVLAMPSLGNVDKRMAIEEIA